MTDTTDSQIRMIYDRWHESIVHRDIDALMALYAEDAVLETPLILVTFTDRDEGVLRGRREIRPFFEKALRSLGSGRNRWFRTGLFFANGRQLVWEYPRDTPAGDQVDLVEVMDIAHGSIRHHRVYWGWVGFQALVGIRDKAVSARVEEEGR